MERRLSILFAIAITATVGCGPKPTSDDENHGRHPMVDAPKISHTITVTAKTDSGTQSTPTMQTCISLAAGDTIMWTSSDGSDLAFAWVVATGPKPYNVTCSGTTCSSGPLQPGNWTSYFDYTLNVGPSPPHPICGRIIIKP